MSEPESVRPVPQNMDGDGIRVVIYCRVSTDDKGQTNENQEFMCRQWCEAHGYEVVEVYRDQMTGTTLLRPQFSMMLNRILTMRDIDFIVAYDQSRITRGEDPSNNFDAVKSIISGTRCRFRFVLMDVTGDGVADRIVQDINTRINAQENRLRSDRTKAALLERKSRGIHVGRPARILFAEDIDLKPKGCFKQGVTVVIPERTLFDYARSGYSLNYVATKIFGISPAVLTWEMRERDPDDPKCRNKGVKDRYTTYMTLYNEAVGLGADDCKGLPLQRVENPDETALQRVVE